MKRLLDSIVPGLCLGITVAIPAKAQITTDGSTNTTLTPTENGIEINSGDTANGNLFHSFEQFSVPTGTEAFFNNRTDVANIFSRVTGGKISQIDGLIRANGTANLFFINPAGILFGKNAALDLGGSFYGSTADSVLFPGDIEFAASNPIKPILTVNAPIGLRFRENPGEIVNQSEVGLAVPAGENLALMGGNITLAGGGIASEAGQGKIELASVADNSVVSLEPENSSFQLGLDGVTDWSNITLNQGAKITTTEAEINLRGNQISLIEGSHIRTQVNNFQVGGEINLQARQLWISERSNLATATRGVKKAGDINLDVADSIKIVGSGFEDFQAQFIARALNSKNPLDIDTVLNEATGIVSVTNLKGATGNLAIDTSLLQLQQGSIVGNITFEQGNLGSLNINTNDLQVIGSGLFSNLLIGSTGQGNLVKINTDNLTVSDGGIISTSTFGTGKGADIDITALEQINILRTSANQLVPTGIFSNSAIGNGTAGNIEIITKRLTLQNGGQITSASGIATREGIILGDGAGGDITIKAQESLEVIGVVQGIFNTNPNTVFVNSSAIASNTFADKNAGEITITDTGNITIADGGVISTASFLDQSMRNFSIASSGRIFIEANALTLNDGSINAENNQSNPSINNDQASVTETDINLRLKDNLTLRNGSNISAQAGENASGGNIDIDAKFIIAFPGNNDILADAEQGRGGDINITAEGILGIQERSSNPPNNTNDIDASSEFGLSGNVIFNVPDTNNIKDITPLSVDVIASETIVANACSTESETSSLIIQGKGGITPAPNLPLSGEIWLGDSKIFTPNNSQLNNGEIKPVKTSQGDIYPARGMVKTEDGEMILTAYSTNNNSEQLRAKNNILGCN